MLNRRDFLKGSVLTILSLSYAPLSALAKKAAISFDYNLCGSVVPGLSENISLAKGYNYQLLACFSDNLFGSDGFNITDPLKSKVKMNKCFGYNNDYLAYFPINGSSKHGILCVNHEYPVLNLMFSKEFLKNNYFKALEIALDSIGHCVMEIKQDSSGKWHIVKNSKFNRRITAANTICNISGYAAGSSRLKSNFLPADKALGTLANCSGGKTPWNTVLTAEENFDVYFGGDFSDSSEAKNLRSLNFKNKNAYKVEQYFERFNLQKNVGEANKYGYIVEIDPFNPDSVPVKRTSLGRFKHESACVFEDPSGHIVVYSGDDQQFEHLYKFITKNKFNPANPDHNKNLLDEGTLYVARFTDGNSLQWLPLVYGQNGLDQSNGFNSQADIVIETRKAAKIVGATKLDRPEGIAIDPFSKKIYVSLTNNYYRLLKDKVSRDSPNIHGYILEIDPEKQHLANNANWQIFYHASKFKDNYALSNPDNLNFDKAGNLWVATDGMERARGVSDSVFKIDMKSNQITRLLNCPYGSEICSPEFTPDNKTLFLSIQHPGEGGTFDKAKTRWPKFSKDLPPLPSVIAINKENIA